MIYKACDKFEWSFLEGMMRKLGFCERWAQLALMCVKFVRFKILFENDLLGLNIPERGLQQGDPLSPYLFIICAEGLSTLLQRCEIEGLMIGVKVTRKAPIVSHLFFADDSFPFCKANMAECNQLLKVLKRV